MRLITANIRTVIKKMASDVPFWTKILKDRYGLKVEVMDGVKDAQWILGECCDIFGGMPEALVRACEVTKLIIEFLGENKPLYPNHGFYRPSDKTVTLNSDMFYHPDMPKDFTDSKGRCISRAEETLVHEWGHALDAALGEPSLQPEWMSLSGWSKTFKPGLKQLIINDPGAPKVVGEMYYNPKLGDVFTRFYGRRNSYDDFADSFSYYIWGMTEKLPATKIAYFDNLLKKYF